ncbi:MAG: hypothetical protein MJZ37_08120 [Bacilli bacterium]|nr:hypothetical protein [Bacilli bacterium]
MAQTESQKRAQALYRKKIKSIIVSFNDSDMDLYDYLQSQDNKNLYIKNLIKADMNKSKK